MCFLKNACFKTNGVVNKLSDRAWGQEHPHTVVAVLDTLQEVVVEWGMHKGKIIGSCFFSKPAVTGENYKDMPRYYAMRKKSDLSASPTSQRDGAPPHWSADVRSYLDIERFQRWTGREVPIAWPPGASDLVCLDFFLGDYGKEIVFSVEIKSLSQM